MSNPTKKTEAVDDQEEVSQYTLQEKRILDAAVDILSTEGPPGLTMRNVARKVGVQLRAVQWYFPTKRDLIRTTLDYATVVQISAGVAALEDESLSPEARLERALELMLSIARDRKASACFNAFTALAVHDEEAFDKQSNFTEARVKVISSLISQINPGLSRSESRDRAIAIFGMIRGTILITGKGCLYESRQKSLAKKMITQSMHIAMENP